MRRTIAGTTAGAAAGLAVGLSVPGGPLTAPAQAQGLATAEPLPAGWAEAEALREAAEQLLALRTELAPDFGVYTAGPCLLGAVLEGGEQATIRYPFEKGKAYVILAAASSAAEDLDLSLTGDEDGEFVQDEMVDALPVVAYVPKADGPADLTLNMWSTSAPAVSVLMILELGGELVSDSQITQAIGACIAAAEPTPAGSPVRFNDVNGRFCLFGAVLAPEESVTIQGVELEGGRATVAGGGDGLADEVNVLVSGSRGQSIAADTDSGRTAAVSFAPPTGGGPFQVTMQNARSERPVVVVSSVLTPG